ncbi:unnamed protein product [Soboliphyme baturini]|uniref:CC domain-containing protein n=1 Tax=Soboliphyme baturini TaxID=241478 RepID=A0A183J598_9BILA|nr:unnamed protein product [Soboliphyme baturini]
MNFVSDILLLLLAFAALAASQWMCQYQEQCPGQFLCVNGYCRLAIPGTQTFCDIKTGAYCPANQVCKYGRCWMPAGAVVLGTYCDFYRPCASGQACKNYQCYTVQGKLP